MYFEASVVENTESQAKKTGTDAKAADILVSDSIANYKTVASFGNDQIILDKFEELLQAKV